jgi:hypothetical protein
MSPFGQQVPAGAGGVQERTGKNACAGSTDGSHAGGSEAGATGGRAATRGRGGGRGAVELLAHRRTSSGVAGSGADAA